MKSIKLSVLAAGIQSIRGSTIRVQEPITLNQQSQNQNLVDQQSISSPLESQQSPVISCTYGLERLYKGQNSMASYAPHKNFVDDLFPGASTSLYWENTVKNQNQSVAIFKKVKSWGRPKEIRKGRDVSLWGHMGIEAYGINQGSLGDSWILGSAAAIAEESKRAMNLFTQKQYDEEGIFELTLYLQGKPYKIVIDDKLPLDSKKQLVATQQSLNGGWWYSLLEKAYAKMHQNYARLEGGLPGEALRTLTGMPVMSHFPVYFPDQYSENNIWQILSSNTAPYNAISGGILKSIHGLKAGHIYTILDAQEIDLGGKKEKVIKLRNPWSSETYTGPWSDNDSRWNDNIKKQLGGHVLQNDGLFWMPLNEFKKAFGTFSIAMFPGDAQPWKVSRIEQQKQNNFLQVSFKNPIQQEIMGTFEGLNSRLLPETCAPEFAGCIAAQIAIVDSHKKVISNQIVEPQTNYGWLHVKNLAPGDYTFYVQFSPSCPTLGLENSVLSLYTTNKCASFKNGEECSEFSGKAQTTSAPVLKPILPTTLSKKNIDLNSGWSAKGEPLKEALQKHLRELKEADENYKKISKQQHEFANQRAQLQAELTRVKQKLSDFDAKVAKYQKKNDASKKYEKIVDQAQKTVNQITGEYQHITTVIKDDIAKNKTLAEIEQKEYSFIQFQDEKQISKNHPNYEYLMQFGEALQKVEPLVIKY